MVILTNILFGVVLLAIVGAVVRFALRQLAQEQNGSGQPSSSIWSSVPRGPSLSDDGSLKWLENLRVSYTEDEMRQMLEEMRTAGPKISFIARKKGSRLIYKVIRTRKGYRVVPLLRGHVAHEISELEFKDQYEYLTSDWS